MKKRKLEAYYVTQSSGRSSVVEHHVANVMVEGSNPFTRSISPPFNVSSTVSSLILLFFASSMANIVDEAFFDL